ncbi:MAG: phage Gp37/Gp68 family protein [Pseudomonadota bacterium]
MGANSKIEWTNHTFNPWWGCLKVSEACKNCYAEAWAKRVGQKVWGQTAPRRFFSDKHWNEPIKWNRRLERVGLRERVFCASMADVFEDRDDLLSHRDRLWDLIRETPNLDWLLLTKRSQNIAQFLPEDWNNGYENVWLGTTVENQKRAEEALPHLTRIPAKVRFISAEPLLEEINIATYMPKLQWVISGGESGPKARPASPSWFRRLMLDCMAHDVAFHFKQWGDWAPGDGENLVKIRIKAADGTEMFKVGKKKAGRVLDGETHNGLPLAS